MAAILSKLKTSIQERKIHSWAIFFFLVYLVGVIKIVTLQTVDNQLFFGIYSLLVSSYILSRFAIAHFYEPEINPTGRNQTHPLVSFGVPAKDEEDNIYETLMRIAASDYPKDRFEIIAVNDGSSDQTLQQMFLAKQAAEKIGVAVTVINWQKNRGKRAGMAECVQRAKGEIIIFIDSDSFVSQDTLAKLVPYFQDKTIAAVAGHAYVANADTNALTKMQAVRYYVAFKAYKASEAIFGSVTCCSGCCSAYRREYILEVLDAWLEQKFWGVPCTYGDDRSLTNFLLQKGYRALYAREATAYTVVPDTFKKFMKQQLRWKKSWIRETLKASTFIWKKNPIMSFSFYASAFLTIVSPLVVVRALVWYPAASGQAPWFYLFGLALMAVIYGLYYYIYTNDRYWVYGVLFASFYTLVLIWQLPWAILNIRDSRWGTR